MTKPAPFQLLEINIISAQDLAPVNRSMRTYAVAWVHPARKLSTRVDKQGHTDPTWNDKFVFRVKDDFLRSETAAVMIEIYTVGFFRDVRVGTVRVLIGNLLPHSNRSLINGKTAMRFVALQVRRPSGRPQGILNIGVTLLDGSLRSMPLYTELSTSALGFRDLMGDDASLDTFQHKAQLRRSRSEHRDPLDDDLSRRPGSILNGSDLITPKAPRRGHGSIRSDSDVGPAPSVVAAAAARGYFPADDMGSSVVDDWSADDQSVEGLRSKLQRWRTELPPIYDHRGYPSFRSPRGHVRRHTDGGGLFSCFGNAYGCECSFVCGAPPNNKKNKKRNGKVHLSPSDDTVSHSIILR